MNVESVTETAAKINPSYLLVHSDTDFTRVIFAREVAGEMSLVGAAFAPSTAHPPEANVMIGVADAIKLIERQTGHHLITTEGELVRNTRSAQAGVDEVLLTTSAFSSWPVLIIAPADNDPALKSAQRLLTSFSNEPAVVWTAENQLPLAEQINAFLALQPLVVLIVGSKDRQNVLSHFGQAMMWAGRLLADNVRPPVIFAANHAGLEAMEQSLANGLVLHVTEDIRPQKRRERLNPARLLLAELIRERNVGRMPGMPDLMRWSLTHPRQDVLMSERYLKFRAREKNGSSLAISIHDGRIWFIYATPTQSFTHIYNDSGLQGIGAANQPVIDLSQTLAWIPETDSQEHQSRLLELLAHQEIWPDTIPEVQLDYLLWLAAAREVLKYAFRQALGTWGMAADKPLQINELVIGGTILRMFFPMNQLVLSVLDGIQPVGLFQIYADRYGALPSLGLLAEHNPKAATQIHKGEPFEALGLAVCTQSKGRKVSVSWQGTAGNQEQTVGGDELQQLEISNIQGGQVRIKGPRRGGVPGVRGRGHDIDADSFIRLYVDTRGRPLKLPNDDKKRQLALLKWQAGMGL